MHAQRHHVDLESFEFLIRNIGAGIDHDGDSTPMAMVRGVLLLAHVIGFLARHLAEVARQPEYGACVVHMHVHLGLACRAGDHHAAAKLRESFAQLAVVDALRR